MNVQSDFDTLLRIAILGDSGVGIFYSLEKYSPSLKWEIDVLLKMLCLCEDSINEEIIWKIINLILKLKNFNNLQCSDTF